MTKKQFDKINNDVNKLLNGEFINSNVKKFCDKYDIKVCECGIGWKVL